MADSQLRWIARHPTGQCQRNRTGHHRARQRLLPASADQSFNLAVTATFLGWQRLNFTSGENDPNAAPAVDGEMDRVPNFIEYATRGNPATQTSFAFPLSFDGSQRATFAIDIRDDDPNLTVVAEIASEARVGSFTTVSAVVTDPTPKTDPSA